MLPGFVIDALAPAVQALVGGRMPAQASQAWLSIVPIAEARSSYNGLLVLVFITASAGLCALAIHQFASRAVRRAPAWDCGAPDPSPATQYTAASFAQPIRRVFGDVLLRRPRDASRCRRPATWRRPASRRSSTIRSGRASTRRSPARSAMRPTG